MKGAEPRLPFAVAGISRRWKGNYKGEVREMNVYSMMTTTPNEVVNPFAAERMHIAMEGGKSDDMRQVAQRSER